MKGLPGARWQARLEKISELWVQVRDPASGFKWRTHGDSWCQPRAHVHTPHHTHERGVRKTSQWVASTAELEGRKPETIQFEQEEIEREEVTRTALTNLQDFSNKGTVKAGEVARYLKLLLSQRTQVPFPAAT